ncbi:hypothetical protein SASPL_107322 [Salvia splendens]|uniref:Response regulatory domain-containing protein n=1 Tax=Salvia splendens TaxID=180675 RepID=A0A8X8YEN5_SALSN|nr:hypothetical protein SASPL_107322 [Salvia splendens]
MESHCFPEGLGILVVDHDHDPQGLDSLRKMLLKCKYKGSPSILFHLILMSDDGETSKVMKGVQHGACHCLLKPIRLKEISNIWQHVFRKRMHQQDDNSNIHVGNKRKHANMINIAGVGADPAHPDPDPDPTPLNKKPRVVWTPELHLKFVNAVHCIGGLEKAGPKKILDLMGEPWLTRDNVASHLQKYRIFVSRQKKEDELKASYNGMNLSGSHQNIVINHNQSNTITGSLPMVANHRDTNICTTPMEYIDHPMVTDQRWEYIDQPMVADQRWEYIDQPMVADQRWEYIDQPMVVDQRWKYSNQAMENGVSNHGIKFSDEPMVPNQGIKFSDEPIEYIEHPMVTRSQLQLEHRSQLQLEHRYSIPHSPRMEATDKNPCSNSLSISYAVGTDHANAYQQQKLCGKLDFFKNL